uniref:C-type lectin domain-containing protein n=1 Tax=Periophthalmus magnuspinnatus TaxID=409849 RepID=A0A3B3ZYI2_9GOBI
FFPTGGGAIRLVIASFGVLCMLQAFLNVGLRLSEHSLYVRTKISINIPTGTNVSYFRGSFYYGSRTTRSWEESRSYCQEHGLLETFKKVTFCFDIGQDFVEIFEGRSWIGLSDKETEGVWKWVDGSPLTISSWMSGEPNDEFGEDCVERRRDNNGKWTFNDLSCTQKRESIREIKL